MSGGKEECNCVNCKSTTTCSAQKPITNKSPGYKVVTLLGPPSGMTADFEKNDAQKYIDLLYRNGVNNDQSTALEFNHGKPPGWDYCLFNPHIKYNSPYHNSHSFEPREDEIVLFYQEPSGLRLDEKTQYLQIFSDRTQKFGGWPKWEAGRVVSTPEPGQLCLQDLAWSASDEQHNPTKTFSIETLPSDEAGCFSPRRVDLHLSHLRPFSMLRELQHGQNQNDWKYNIIASASMMSNLCLIEPCAFIRLIPDGDSPAADSKSLDAKFRCRQMWIGAEKIIEGDVVRLMPSGNGSIIDSILIIKEISYTYEHLEAVLPTGGVYLEGRSLTITRPQHKSNPVVKATSTYEELALQNLPRCMHGYTWYDVGDPEATCRLPPESVVGRCYEREAMELMIYAPDLNIGLDSVRQSRRWAITKGDDKQDGWIWGEHQFGKESYARLNDLKVGRSRGHECVQSLDGPNNYMDSQVGRGFDNVIEDESDSLDDAYGQMGKMSISGSRTSHGKEDEADAFVRKALESPFDDDSEDGHVAKRLRK